MFQLPQSFMQRPNPGLFSRSWQQAPQQAFQGTNAQQAPPWLSQFAQNPMFRAAGARQQMPFMSYLPLLLSRGLFGTQGPMSPPMQQPSFASAAPVTPPTTPPAIQAAAQQMQQLAPPPPLFTPPPQGTPQPQAAAAPAAPVWQPASWFSDPNSAARRIAAQAWGGLPLQQQQQFYADTYMGGQAGDGPAGNDFGLGFGIDTAAGIY